MILSTGSQWFSHRRIDQKQTRFGTFLAPPTGWRPTDPYKKGPPTAIHKMLESQSSLRTPPLLVEPRDSYANVPWKNNLRFSELHVIFHGFGTSNHLTFVLLEAYTCMWCSSITQDSTELINDSSLSLSVFASSNTSKHFTWAFHGMILWWSPVVVRQEFKVSHWLLLQKVLVLGTSPAKPGISPEKGKSQRPTVGRGMWKTSKNTF